MCPGKPGFTLIELIVAIAVISVATTVFLSLYFSSLGIAENARNQRLAAEVAQDRLAYLQAHPEAFLWDIPEAPDGERFNIKLSADEPPIGNAVEGPAVLPTDPAAGRRSERIYQQFSWNVFGKFPVERAATEDEPARYGKDYYEVSVVVTWEDKGRMEWLALTSAIPRDRVPGRTGS